MIKKIFLSALAAVALSANAQENNALTLYMEDFQAGMPYDMTYYDLDGLPIASSLSSIFENGTWSDVANSVEDENLYAASTSLFVTPGQANDWMITPGITLGSGTIQLTWDGCVPDNDTRRGGYKVYLSTRGTAVENFDVLLYECSAENNNWTAHTVDLGQYANQTVYIAFVHDSNNQYIVGIDNITVTCTELPLRVENVTPTAGFEQAQVSVLLTNCSSDMQFNSCSLFCQIDGGEMLTQTYNNIGLTSYGRGALITLDLPIPLTAGTTTGYEIWVEANGQEYARGYYTIEGYPFQPEQRVIVENVTGLTEMNSPLGYVATEYMLRQYGDRFVNVAVHGSSTTATTDPYIVDGYATFCGNTYPSGIIQRKEATSFPIAEVATMEYTTLLDAYENLFLKALREVAPFNISGEATTTAAGIDYNIQLHFAKDADLSDYRWAFIITENNLTGTQSSAFNSSNYSTAQLYTANGIVDDPFVNFVEAGAQVSNFEMDDVARFYSGELSEDLNGNSRVDLVSTIDGLPATATTDQVITLTGTVSTLNAPADINYDNANLICIITRDNGQSIYNVLNMPLGSGSGIADAKADNGLQLSVAGQTASVMTAQPSEVRVELYGMDGGLISNWQFSVNGTQNFELPSILSSGVYILKAYDGNNETTCKFVF